MVGGKELSGLKLGTPGRREAKTFPLRHASVPSEGHSYHAERRTFLGDRGYLCVCSCRILFHFERSSAPCFSKPVNAEISLERPVLDPGHPQLAQALAGFSHSLELVFM